MSVLDSGALSFMANAMVDIGGDRWTRSTTTDGETALSREADGVTVLVSGSATDEELRTVAESVRPYSG